MANMRAKLKLESVTKTEHGETLNFMAVCGSGKTADGIDEDNTYSKYTPSASLTMYVNNPALIGKFVPGEKYYVNFELAAIPPVAAGA
jgi:hypothetical protein